MLSRSSMCQEFIQTTVVSMFLYISGLLLSFSLAAQPRPKPCHVLFTEGVNSYLDEKWADCIENLESGVECYRNFKQQIVKCRVKCRHETKDTSPIFPVNIEDLNFYEKLIKNTLCLQKCRKVMNEDSLPATIPKDTEEIFEDLKAYEYLHMCYFQKNLIQKAASAVFTYLVNHPDDRIMHANLKYYINLPEVDINLITNFEAKEYVSLYIRGADADEKEDYNSVIHYIESSLEGYLQAEEECRANCEGSFDQGWFPDFISSVANHFTYVLKCKAKCSSKLNSLNGEVHDDLLESHYHFLQFAYFKTGKLAEACKAVASFLLFHPVDETMINNKKYYLKLPKVNEEYFKPRQEAMKYVQRQKYESELLAFIEKEFQFAKEIEYEMRGTGLNKETLHHEKEEMCFRRNIGEWYGESSCNVSYSPIP